MSWKPEVRVNNDAQWYDNALRFATKDEAENAANDLMSRWNAVRACRATESDDEVNHSWADGKLRAP